MLLCWQINSLIMINRSSLIELDLSVIPLLSETCAFHLQIKLEVLREILQTYYFNNSF